MQKSMMDFVKSTFEDAVNNLCITILRLNAFNFRDHSIR